MKEANTKESIIKEKNMQEPNIKELNTKEQKSEIAKSNPNPTFEDFCKTIETLRAPGGCPWDAKQTHESLRACMTEEAAEVNAAIRIYTQTGDDANLCEELGDVLLQVVMHSQIAKDENRFSIEDVIKGIQEKMIRRHPHVFADTVVSGSEEVLKNWDEIKKQEKATTVAKQNPLRDIPPELPVLLRGTKILKRIDKMGEKAHSLNESHSTIQKQLDMLLKYEKSEYSQKKDNSKELEKILGETLLEMLNIAKALDINVNQALEDVLEKKIQTVEDSKNLL